MINKKEIVAMLLAGGQGSRLFALTQKKAKPAVSYGGKYKIIDFPLSNCTNSGIDTVGVLTQYEPLELNAYIGTGGFWDLDSLNGGAYVLPPYMKGETGNWYRGTADAIYQNINFIDNFDPDHIIVLSGDQICTMDYDKMLQYHKEKGADCTISVLNVTYEEAKRFGIMNTDEDERIYEFEEKPAEPKSTKASMGIYIFKWKLIRQYLMEELQIPDYRADICAAFSQGNVGKAKRLALSDSFGEMLEHALHMVKYISEMEPSDLVEDLKKINTYKMDIQDYLDLLTVWYRDVLMFKATCDANNLVFSNELNSIRDKAKDSSYEGLECIIKALEKAKVRLNANVNFDMAMELLLLTMKEN